MSLFAQTATATGSEAANFFPVAVNGFSSLCNCNCIRYKLCYYPCCSYSCGRGAALKKPLIATETKCVAPNPVAVAAAQFRR